MTETGGGVEVETGEEAGRGIEIEGTGGKGTEEKGRGKEVTGEQVIIIANLAASNHRE